MLGGTSRPRRRPQHDLGSVLKWRGIYIPIIQPHPLPNERTEDSASREDHPLLPTKCHPRDMEIYTSITYRRYKIITRPPLFTSSNKGFSWLGADIGATSQAHIFRYKDHIQKDASRCSYTYLMPHSYSVPVRYTFLRPSRRKWRRYNLITRNDKNKTSSVIP